MTKKKKLVKNALKNPEAYTPAEIKFFERWLLIKKQQKAVKKEVNSPS
jgi:hypothetical protein